MLSYKLQKDWIESKTAKPTSNRPSFNLNSQKFFQKRAFTFKTLRFEIRRFFRHRYRIIDTFRSKRLNQKSIERMMMAITAVNKCRYCSFVHTRMALTQGCSEKEILEILCLDLSHVPLNEAIALAFCQHYAESDRHPNRDAIRKLIKTYGAQKSRDIYHVISAIYFGNLIGNTIDAFESRLKGIPPQQGSALLEFLVYFLGGFLFNRIILWYVKKQQQK